MRNMTARSASDTDWILHRGTSAYLREDRSPLSLAFQDKGFRAQGLSGDRLGDIMDFFELTEREAHHLLCYCHYASSVTSMMVAERARELASKRTLRQMLDGVRLRLLG